MINLSSVYIGSWFPKTNMHLKEFELFLRYAKVSDKLDQQKAVQLHNNLHALNLTTGTNQDGVKFLTINCGSITITYFGDGLLILKKTVEDIDRDMADLIKFYHEKLTPVLSFLYSRGAKGMEVIRTPGGGKTFFISGQKNSKATIDTFFASYEQYVHSTTKYKESAVHYADDMVLLNVAKNPFHKDVDEVIAHLILFHEVKTHTTQMLEAHRTVWDQVDELLSGSSILVKDLPRYNETLTDLSNRIDNLSARVDLMKLNFGYRQNKVRDNDVLFLKLWPNFENLQQNLEYTENIFQMTRQHLQNNISHISTIYQEGQEKALNRLQMLFLLNVVTDFVYLGGYVVQDPNVTEPIANSFIGFHWTMLVKFGSWTLLASFVIYFLWNYIYQNVRTRLRR